MSDQVKNYSNSQRGSILGWMVVAIWGCAFLSVIGLFFGVMVGTVDPLSAGSGSAPSETLFDSPVGQPDPVEPLTRTSEPVNRTSTPSPTEDLGTPLPINPTLAQAADELLPQVRVEATFTPLIPVTPTPTFFITPFPLYEGPILIGYSKGGRPLEVYRFGNGPVHRMIVAGIHGGYEWNTIALADEMIAFLIENPDYVPSTVTFFILRALNPDGYARAIGVEGRVNNNGVDLNRNFPINWAKSWSRRGCWNYRPTSAGSGPGSEPETIALMEFVENQTHVTAMISYHSAALGIFPGGEPPHPASARLAEALAETSEYPYPPIDTGCIYTGTLPDWAAAIGIAAVDLELHTHEYTDFEENLAVLETFLAWRK